ncbi:hypothetical protein [Nesterenkonia xinjiangensis]|uniref:ABC transporter n=1 Tax=Nesterenkonia xinjiangensis TaxID=225327 RepID=A0A7Z0GN86_9MICC|nr:hypothetical protein [Nesterenkonia xinjiangensis]NYJ79125.1 hypothetical protein [Nesterenkonia xinjiangensis]
MLRLQDVAFDGHRGRILDPTSFSAADGALSGLQASTSLARTSLALISSGRMVPDQGTVLLDDVEDLRALRHRTALVDSPGITAPEHHMTVKNVVSESLALRPLRSRVGREARRIGVRAWLAEHEAEDIAGDRIDTLEPLRRLGLLIELAFSDPAVRFAVVDSPDRHDVDIDELADFLSDRCDFDSGRSLLALLETPPVREDITCAFAGHHDEPPSADEESTAGVEGVDEGGPEDELVEDHALEQLAEDTPADEAPLADASAEDVPAEDAAAAAQKGDLDDLLEGKE